MTRWIATLLTAAAISGATPVLAQESAPGPSTVVVTIIPGGATFFTEAKDNPQGSSFGNYGLGGSVAVHLNRYLAVEGEIGGALGISQSLQLGAANLDERTPHLLNYSGNLVVSAATGTSVVPYATAGVGGLSLLSREEFGVDDTETLFTTNVGGGVKWNPGRWGLRADYRFIAIPSRDSVSAFGFGTEARYGHRIYGAVILNVGR